MSETTKPDPIRYARPGTHDTVWSKFTGWFAERFNGIAEFIGILIGIIGSVRQVLFAIGLAIVAGGFGRSLYHDWHGPRWMFLGALLVGLTLPLKWRDR